MKADVARDALCYSKASEYSLRMAFEELDELERLAEIGRATERTAEFRNVHLSYDGDDDDTWECSECKQAWIIDGNPKEHHYHFCPHCGAKFEEVTDGR